MRPRWSLRDTQRRDCTRLEAVKMVDPVVVAIAQMASLKRKADSEAHRDKGFQPKRCGRARRGFWRVMRGDERDVLRDRVDALRASSDRRMGGARSAVHSTCSNPSTVFLAHLALAATSWDVGDLTFPRPRAAVRAASFCAAGTSVFPVPPPGAGHEQWRTRTPVRSSLRPSATAFQTHSPGHQHLPQDDCADKSLQFTSRLRDPSRSSRHRSARRLVKGSGADTCAATDPYARCPTRYLPLPPKSSPVGSSGLDR